MGRLCAVSAAAAAWQRRWGRRGVGVEVEVEVEAAFITGAVVEEAMGMPCAAAGPVLTLTHSPLTAIIQYRSPVFHRRGLRTPVCSTEILLYRYKPRMRLCRRIQATLGARAAGGGRGGGDSTRLKWKPPRTLRLRACS
jgi:hypothetical protein